MIIKAQLILASCRRSPHYLKFLSSNRHFLTAPFRELENFPASIDNYEKLHKFSIDETDKFWGTLAKSRLQWINQFSQVTTGDFNDKNFKLKWFVDGKLNASVNCVDRHYLQNPDKVALIWDKDQIGWFQ